MASPRVSDIPGDIWRGLIRRGRLPCLLLPLVFDPLSSVWIGRGSRQRRRGNGLASAVEFFVMQFATLVPMWFWLRRQRWETALLSRTTTEKPHRDSVHPS